MKRIFSFLLVISIFISNSCFVLAETEENSVKLVEFIIRYDSDVVNNQQTNDIVTTINGNDTVEIILENQLSNTDDIEIKDEVTESDSIKTQLISLNTNNIEQTLNELNNINGVIYAEPNYRIYKASSEPYFSNQWALNGTSDFGINVDEAWELTTGSDDVIVAIIDTGVDITHEDLVNNIFINENEVINSQDDDGNGYVDDTHGWDFTTYQSVNDNGDNSVYDGTIIEDENVDSHGTHVAGIVAAELNSKGVCGVAPNITVLPVKILDANGGTVFQAIKAIEYAEAMGAKIANCSWTSENYSQFLHDTMNNSDMLFICASGNDGNNCEENPTYPANYSLDNIISVGATDSNGALADFSNYGTDVDIAAPGKEIYSTLPNNTYGYMDGTSMAAPYVTGVASLLLSVSSDLTAAELKNRVLNTVEVVNGLNATISTSGIVNASRCIFTTVVPNNLIGNRYGNEILIADDEIYSLGGYDGTQYINTVEKFSPSTQTWTNITNIPIAVADSAVAYYNNKIVIVGGFNGNPVNNVQIYDISEDTWTVGASLPQGIYGSSYIQKDDTLYLFGGINNGGYINAVFQYNITENSWQTKTSMPYSNAYSAAVGVDNSVYILGGVGNKGVSDDIYVYNIEKDAFIQEGKLNVRRKDFSALVYDEKIYVFGGSNTYTSQEKNKLFSFNDSVGAYIESLLDNIEIYDTKTRMASVVDTLDRAIMGSTAYKYFENVYLSGGWNGDYSNLTRKYFGTSIPKNIRFKTKNNKLTVKWNPIADATGYQIEFDDVVYNVSNSLYEQIADDTEHKVRIRALKNDDVSLWSDYTYHYLNSSLLDAKEILPNSVNTDKLYEKGQQRWYKINNFEAGTITISLENIAESCDYVVQLCDLSGKVIATGVDGENGCLISNVILNPYSYYIKVFSAYGGNATDNYVLNCSFVPSDESEIPDRIKSAFLRPSNLDDLSVSDTNYVDITEYEGTEVPPIDISPIAEIQQNNTNSNGGAKSTEIFDETESENIDEISTLSLSNSNEETGTIANQGTSISKSVTVPAYTGSSGNKIKLVIAVVPDNDDDIFRLEWTGSNTDYSNFWQHWHGDNEYYLTTLISYASYSRTYNYKMTYDYKASDSTGTYTLKTYIIVDSSSNEDFKSTAGNDNATIADTISVSSNSSSTYTGKLDHMYDWDFYKISVSANQKIAAYLTSPSGYQYRVNLLDHTGNSTDLLSSQYFDGDYGEEGVAYSVIETTTTRTYLILVQSRDYEVTPDETYTLQVFRYNTSALGDLEVNDTTDQADSKMTSFVNNYLGTTSKSANAIDFSIDFPADIDYYAVDLSIGDKLSVLMELPTSYDDSAYQYRIGIQDEEYIHTYNNPDSLRSKYVTFIAERSGTHYVSVRSKRSMYSYAMSGTLKITKTASAEMDINEVTTKSLPLYGNYSATNDFVFTTVFSFFGSEYGINAANNVTANISAKLDNELDVDWYCFSNGTESKTATIELGGSNTLQSSVDVIVFDSQFNLLNSSISGKTYTFSPNEKYYIAVCVKSEYYSNIINNNAYTLGVTLEDLRSDLIFEPLDWGTFIYDNDPEFLTDDDMADYDLGNRFLMSADGVSGVIDFQSSHSAKSYMLSEKPISFDMLLYNPTDKPVTVVVDRIGYQLPYENSLAAGVTDWTTTNWVCLKAWADFLHINIRNDMLIGREKPNYQDYNFQYVNNQLPNQGVYVIESGKSVWMLGDARPTMKRAVWSPFNFLSRIKVLDDGVINLGFAAFRDVNKVYAPQSAKLIYDMNTQRTYPTGLPYSEKEHDVNGKPKGVATSAAETETHTSWIIEDNEEYFSPTLYNYANPDGYTLGGTSLDYWVTNFNPNADAWGYNYGVESDIIPLIFNDKDQNGNITDTWIFDNRHTNPLSGNTELSGPAPVENAMPLGNYGVVERYYIDIVNRSGNDKKISYIMNTSSHAIVTYKDGDKWWDTKIKLSELQQSGENYTDFELNAKIRTIFEIELGANESKQLIVEVILPNADAGGFRHQLKAVNQ